MKKLGIVLWFDDVKGLGFIRTKENEDVFVHWKSIKNEGFKSLSEGQKVQFETANDNKGNNYATKVFKL